MAGDTELEELRKSLLRERAKPLGPHEGDEAFRQHKLLAAAIHRATGLNSRRSESETDAWERYFVSYFPEHRNGPKDARRLFAEWRTGLLKDDSPGPSVAITHGLPKLHWRRNATGQLCINLEDMWDDFAHSVDRFIQALQADTARQKVVLERWKVTLWEVVGFLPYDAFPGATAMSASASSLSVSSSSASMRFKADGSLTIHPADESDEDSDAPDEEPEA